MYGMTTGRVMCRELRIVVATDTKVSREIGEGEEGMMMKK